MNAPLCKNCNEELTYFKEGLRTNSGKKYYYRCDYCNFFDSDFVLVELFDRVSNLEKVLLQINVKIKEIETLIKSKKKNNDNIIAYSNTRKYEAFDIKPSPTIPNKKKSLKEIRIDAALLREKGRVSISRSSSASSIAELANNVGEKEIII